MEVIWRLTSQNYLKLSIPATIQDIQGGIGYLDAWEDVIIKYKNVAPEEATTSDSKRSVFAAQFTIMNDTDFLIEQVRDTTETWDKMASSLRKKLARRNELNTRTASCNARTNNANTINQQEMIDLEYFNWANIGQTKNKNLNQTDTVAIQTFINAIKHFNGPRKEDWNVGYNLWSILSE